MKVRALRTGYYEHLRRRGDDVMGEGNGDVFELIQREITLVDTKTQVRTGTRILSPEDQFSENWMVKVEDDTPERTTGAQAVLTKMNDDILSTRRPGRPRKESNL